MPRKRNRFKPSAPITGIREEPRLMFPFESVMDYIHRRSFLHFITSGFFSVNPHEDPCDLYQSNFAHNALEPHPRIRELVEEEADKHAQELIEEEKKQKEKAEKNRRKKLRKKEKRLEKQNAVKALSPDEEGNSENREEDDFIEADGGRNRPVESLGTRHPTETDEDEERSQADEEEEKTAEEDAEIKVLYRDPEPDRQQATVAKKSSPLRGRNLEQDQDPTQNTADPAVEEDKERSRELAATGFLLAAAGQYDMAVKYFTDAINYNPKEFKLFGNRSLCYERMQQYAEAYRDADRALSIEPRWIKGLFRKGKALCGLKRYYEASLIYREVMDLDSSSMEAKQELRRAQTLHLMEEDGSSEGEEEWIIQRYGRHRGQHAGESVKLSRLAPSPTPRSGKAVKPVGTVYSIKMLLEHQCAFVNYTTEEECGRAIQCLNGKVVEGAPVTVRYPSPSLCTNPRRTKECFFWRTFGCTRSDCIYKHDPNHRGIDRDKFTDGLGHFRT